MNIKEDNINNKTVAVKPKRKCRYKCSPTCPNDAARNSIYCIYHKDKMLLTRPQENNSSMFRRSDIIWGSVGVVLFGIFFLSAVHMSGRQAGTTEVVNACLANGTWSDKNVTIICSVQEK